MPRSFPAVVGENPKILILGSMPGTASLKKAQYYAHPQNQFWKLLGEALGEDLPLMTYERRLEILKSRGIALWDVLESCEREGSLDADISDEKPNAIGKLVRETGLRVIFLNGGKAEAAFKAFVAESLPSGVQAIRLPSSSPANAGFTYAEKADAWRRIAEHLVS
jgi:hypoxanthine-DNA glycosylase